MAELAPAQFAWHEQLLPAETVPYSAFCEQANRTAGGPHQDPHSRRFTVIR